jgi:protein disulfide-isomerase
MMKINLLVLALALLTLSACKKQENTNVNPSQEDETQAVETASETSEDVVTPEDDGIWTVNMEFAKKIAEEKNIDLMILFTGSDWCIWCKRMAEEIFSDETFQNEVVKKFVPVKLDFPSRIKFPEEIQNAYRAEQKKYGIKGYPTVILADSKGGAFAACGYQPGGGEAFLQTLDSKLEARQALAEKAAAAEKGGEAEAKELYTALEEYTEEYKDFPCIKDGLAKYYDICKEKSPELSRAVERERKVREELAELDKQYSLGEGYDPSDISAETAPQAEADYRALIAKYGLEGQQKQEILLKLALLYTMIQESEKSDAIVEEAVAVAPDSEVAETIKSAKKRMEMEELMEKLTQFIIDDQKDEAVKAIDERLAKEDDINYQIDLTSTKAEILVLFDDIEGAKENFQKCVDMCGNEEATEQFKTRLNELDPFNKAVTQSQLFLMRGDPQGMVDAIDKAIAEHSPDPASLQKAYFMQAQAYAETRNEVKVTEALQKSIDAMPDSELAEGLRKNLEAIKLQTERQKQAIEKMAQERAAQAEEEAAGGQEEEQGE